MNLDATPNQVDSSMNGLHLTDEQLDELLLGLASVSDTARMKFHLDFCPPCSTKLAEFQTTLGLFNKASLSWSQAKSNTLTRDLTTHTPTRRVTARAAWSFASALALAVALSISSGMHAHTLTLEADNRVPAQTSTADPRSQEIARDNEMLQAIDTEIAQPETAPVQLYDSSDTASAHSNARQVRD